MHPTPPCHICAHPLAAGVLGGSLGASLHRIPLPAGSRRWVGPSPGAPPVDKALSASPGPPIACTQSFGAAQTSYHRKPASAPPPDTLCPLGAPPQGDQRSPWRAPRSEGAPQQALGRRAAAPQQRGLHDRSRCHDGGQLGLTGAIWGLQAGNYALEGRWGRVVQGSPHLQPAWPTAQVQRAAGEWLGSGAGVQGCWRRSLAPTAW